jgi:hypothetical protein
MKGKKYPDHPACHAIAVVLATAGKSCLIKKRYFKSFVNGLCQSTCRVESLMEEIK